MQSISAAILAASDFAHSQLFKILSLAHRVHRQVRPQGADKERSVMGLPAQTWPMPTRRPKSHRSGALAAPDGHHLLLAWALTSMAAAEERVAELEARLAYVEGLTVTDELTPLLNPPGFLPDFSPPFESAPP